MSALADMIAASPLAGRVFNESQIGDLVGGSQPRRYALVNRALKDGTLVRLKRGTYVLSQRVAGNTVHPFAAAQALLPGSYVSFETALAHHGWIPEGVVVTACVSPHRKTLTIDTPTLGPFTFHPLALHDYQFLSLVSREKLGKLTSLVAQPLRALMDLVALRKEHWSSLDWLTRGMRIDEQRLKSIRRKDLVALRSVYKHKAAQEFLRSLEASIR